MKRKININLKKISLLILPVLLFASGLLLLYFQIGLTSFSSMFFRAIDFAHGNTYSSSQSGTTAVEYETYEMSGAYITVPSKGNSQDSRNFQGYKVYEYFYPANPEKNNDSRKVLYSYNANGSIETAGNFVVQGDQTMLNSEYQTGNVSIASYEESGGKKENYRSHMDMEPKNNNVSMSGSAYVNYNWNEDNKSGMGPSVFVNPNTSKLEFNKTSNLSLSKKDIVIETNLDSGEGKYYWEEYFVSEESGKRLLSPSAFFYQAPYFYVADMGKKRIVRHNPVDGDFIALGRNDWNWVLSGITVDSEGFIYVTDAVRNIVIKTKIDGSGWEESYRNIDDYQSRLYLEGSERAKSFDFWDFGEHGAFANYGIIYDCGYNAHEVYIRGYWGGIQVNKDTTAPLMMSTENCAFGGSCFKFNGSERMDIEDSAAWNFGNQTFTIDFWVQFATVDRPMTLISHPGSYIFEWDIYTHDPANPGSPNPTLNFAFINNERNSSGEFSYQSFKHAWMPEVGEWYHLAIVRSKADELLMFVDGELLGQPTKITGTLRDGDGLFQIGGYLNGKAMKGQMDEIRVAKGNTEWSVDYSDLYEFDKPRGIINVDENLYVVDSGHNRIVKMSKDFHGWSTFGEKGSGAFQFNNPVDIYHHGGYFYITDTGNKRVIKTDMKEMVHYLKGESGGSWEVVYSSDSPDLHGVMFDGANLVITDAYNSQIIKNGQAIGSKNPWDLLFRFTSPVDVQPGVDGKMYILDGSSNFDFTANVINRSLDLYGAKQKEGINVRTNEGGVITDNVRSQSVIARLNLPDWYRWVGDDAGPAVAHCPIEENQVKDFGSCTGQWKGIGRVVDCGKSENAPPSECVGQWDWKEHWATCTRYIPQMDLIPVCQEAKMCERTVLVTQPDLTTLETIEAYECGCNKVVYDCFTYCTKEEFDCHEGYAVAYSFYEKGPPEWYLNGKWNQ
jgi:hypothetical protein